MDEFLSIILLIVVYAIAFSAKGKGKKKKRAASAQKAQPSAPGRSICRAERPRSGGQAQKRNCKNSQPALQQQRASVVKNMQAEQLAEAAKAAQAAPALRAEQTMLPGYRAGEAGHAPCEH